MKRVLPLFVIVLGACNQEPQETPNIHDSKYRAVDANGVVLDALPDRWPCVFDQFTGLTWEVKSDEPGLHDWRNTYSWYDPDEASDELDYRGMPDGGQCTGSRCDVHALVAAVNEQGHCGYHDWRLATRDELASISDPARVNDPPTINTAYFPFARPEEYWSGNDYSFQWDAAWLWNFRLGHDRVEWKATPRYARLVRGQAQGVQRVKD